MPLLNKSQINKILAHAPRLKCLVIGDCILDHYIWGDVHRISPEAPVPIVNVDHESYRLGGACNVALNLRKLGCNVTLMGLIGQDRAGETMRLLLDSDRIELATTPAKPDVQTVLKTRIVVRNQQLCRLDRERSFTEQQAEALLPIVKKMISDVNVVILSDYNKGTLTQTLVQTLEKFREKHNFFLAVDPKPNHHLVYRAIDLLKPNQSEALQLSGISYGPYEPFPLSQVVSALFKHYGTRYLSITLGKQGMVLWDKKTDSGQIYATGNQEVFDVSGAGDTALSALTLALNAEMTSAEAATFANIASGIVVGKVGTAAVTPEEILSYVD